MAWNDLSVAQRSQLIGLFLKNGVQSLSQMRSIYDTYHSSSPLVEATPRPFQAAPVYGGGGSIHIKPENRGKFTALKERTGHSATWFKENGTPAQKKMATFALNAAKWKHPDGGELTPRRVDFERFMDTYGNRGRPLVIEDIRQLEDSLIGRGYKLPQRLAILGTSAQEMGNDGAASIGVGGNGYLGYSSGRMPVELLGRTPEQKGKQIKFLLDDLESMHPNNWNGGGTGGPYIKNAKDGFNKFWNADNTRYATQVLNKSNIRPAGGVAAANNRAQVAENMGLSLEQRPKAESFIDTFKQKLFDAVDAGKMKKNLKR